MTKLAVWTVQFADEFDPEFDALPSAVQDEILALAGALKKLGPLLGRPQVDTLQGSKHDKMKELRFRIEGEPAGNGVWRVAFAFDTKRRAILFVADNKQGKGGQARFYRELIRKADQRYDAHERRVAAQEREGGDHGKERQRGARGTSG